MAITEHSAVVTAIANRAPEEARLAMAAHLSNSHDRFTANITPGGHGEAPAPPRRRAAPKPA
jgi:DNA-binding FadR family transcriptional regulator